MGFVVGSMDGNVRGFDVGRLLRRDDGAPVGVQQIRIGTCAAVFCICIFGIPHMYFYWPIYLVHSYNVKNTFSLSDALSHRLNSNDLSKKDLSPDCDGTHRKSIDSPSVTPVTNSRMHAGSEIRLSYQGLYEIN